MTKQNITLKVELRKDKEGKMEKLNPQDFIPAIIYGAGKENKNLKIKPQDFYKAYEKAGESNLIDLEIPGKKELSKVIIKEIQKDVVKDFVIHVDFYEVDMTKEIVTEIPLNFVGESKAVREFGAELITNISEVEVKCLPGDLVDHIDVDLSALEHINDSINLYDITLPKGIKLVSEEDNVIASVKEPQIIEEPEPVVETAEGEEVSGAEEEKEDKTEETKDEEGDKESKTE